MRVIAILSLCLAAVTAVPANPQRIVGGTVTTIDEYPTIVALLYSFIGVNFSQSCGGTILTRRSILTAGHCIDGDSVNRWRARVGSTYSNSGGVVHGLNYTIIHPNYNPITIDNDIAILRTASVIAYSNVVKPANIAGTGYNLFDNEIVWAAGWGTTSAGGLLSEQLRHVQMWTINQDICKTRYAGHGANVTDNMLCSGWLDVGGRDQCQGDSGGPLYHNGVVVGICSWGLGCANAYYPGVNTRVSRFTPWIRSKVN